MVKLFNCEELEKSPRAGFLFDSTSGIGLAVALNLQLLEKSRNAELYKEFDALFTLCWEALGPATSYW